jgi:uncharacterized protein YecE (DUF72 family)
MWIGVSGWAYDSWKNVFYPPGLAARRRLEYASRRFNSLEINASFYGLLTPETYRRWYRETPRGFRFSLKGSRFITHNKKLEDVEAPLANYFASGLLLLREKLGPIVWQLGPRLRFEPERLERFFRLLPQDTRSAARLARAHDHRLDGRSWTRIDRPRPLRHALEARHESYRAAELATLARHYGVALVVSDSGDWPRIEEVSSDFVYVRLHGRPRTYASRYGPVALRTWADRIRQWQAGRQPADARRISEHRPRRAHRDVYVYFDNDQRGHAPRDALGLMRQVADGDGRARHRSQ